MKISNNLQKYISDLRKETNEKIKNLLSEEAKKSVRYKIGDVIETSADKGKVKSIAIYIDPDELTYTIRYTCDKLTKYHRPYKTNRSIHIYQQHIKKLHVI